MPVSIAITQVNAESEILTSQSMDNNRAFCPFSPHIYPHTAHNVGESQALSLLFRLVLFTFFFIRVSPQKTIVALHSRTQTVSRWSHSQTHSHNHFSWIPLQYSKELQSSLPHRLLGWKTWLILAMYAMFLAIRKQCWAGGGGREAKGLGRGLPNEMSEQLRGEGSECEKGDDCKGRGGKKESKWA